MDDNRNLQRDINDANNTNNVRNAARLASKSANPYAKAAGTAINVADKVSGGKASEKIGSSLTKVNENSPMGSKIQDASNKLSESGVSDKIGNAASNLGEKNTSDNTSNGLSNRVGAKKYDNTPDALKNRDSRRNNNRYSSYNNKSSADKDDSKDENKDEENKDNNEEDRSEEQNEEKKSNQKLKVLLKILPIIFTAVFVIFLGVIVVFSIIMPVLSAYSWFVNLFHHKTDKATSYEIYNKNEEAQLKAERAYMDAIVGSQDGSVKGIIKEYEEFYGVTIDWYLLNAIITYRYSIVDIDLLYKDDSGDIDETEFEEALKQADQSDSSDSEGSKKKSQSINYTDAKKKIETVADLMIISDGPFSFSYRTDNKKDGEVYNKLLKSKFLTTYYKDFLKNNTEENRKKLVDDIFDYAEGAREFLEDKPKSTAVISDSIIVHLQTCKRLGSPYYRYKKINNYTVYDNDSAAEGTNFPDYLDLKDYLRGLLYREIGIHEEYKEAMKAQAIAALTYMINDSKSGFDMKTGEMYFPSGTCRQATCSPKDGCSQVQVSGGIYTFYIGTTKSSHSFRPMNENELRIADEVINDIFGKIMVNKGVTADSFKGSKDTVPVRYLDSCGGGKCFSQQGAIRDAKNGMKYEDILKKYYSGFNYDIIDIKEGLYATADYTNQDFKGDVKYYNQGNYSSTTFCGVPSKSIKGSGCGLVSSAIVAVSLTGNTKYDPIYMNSIARKGKDCGSGLRGVDEGFFEYMASTVGLTYQEVTKSQTNTVVNALKSGNSLVIAHMGPGTFTTGGHYIVLAAINESGDVKVYDPGHIANTEKWFSINLIANQLKGKFFIFSKRG